MKTTCISILISTMLFNSMDAHKHDNKEKLSINSFSLFACQLALKKSCLTIKKLKLKVSLHCIDINADDCIIKILTLSVRSGSFSKTNPSSSACLARFIKAS